MFIYESIHNRQKERCNMLILPIKKKWFDMIASQEKTEEYREIKPYYRKRFETIGLLDVYGLPVVNKVWVILRNGYSTKSPQIEAEVTLDIKEGQPEWGSEPGVEYYVLKILRICCVPNEASLSSSIRRQK